MAEAIAKGTQLAVQNSGSPQSFLTIDGLTSINPTRQNMLAEVTDYDDAHVRHIYTGVKDGSLQVVYNRIDADLAQIEMEAALVDGAERTFRWRYSDPNPDVDKTFTAIVESIAEAPALKGVVAKTAVLKVTSVMA